MTADIKRQPARFQVTLEALFDEKTSKILDDFIRESRKEIFESTVDLPTPKQCTH